MRNKALMFNYKHLNDVPEYYSTTHPKLRSISIQTRHEKKCLTLFIVEIQCICLRRKISSLTNFVVAYRQMLFASETFARSGIELTMPTIQPLTQRSIFLYVITKFVRLHSIVNSKVLQSKPVAIRVFLI